MGFVYKFKNGDLNTAKRFLNKLRYSLMEFYVQTRSLKKNTRTIILKNRSYITIHVSFEENVEESRFEMSVRIWIKSEFVRAFTKKLDEHKSTSLGTLQLKEIIRKKGHNDRNEYHVDFARDYHEFIKYPSQFGKTYREMDAYDELHREYCEPQKKSFPGRGDCPITDLEIILDFLKSYDESF
jgi:hypothetical protein